MDSSLCCSEAAKKGGGNLIKNYNKFSAKAEKRTIKPCPRLEGEITLPGDKSISHRAVIFNSLAKGKAEIANFAPGKDCLATVRCLRSLGVEIGQKGPKNFPTLLVSGTGKEDFKEAANVLNAGDSGTTMRLLGGLLSTQPFLSIITGDASLRSRPMGRLIAPLRLMGAEIWGRGKDSLAPLVIKGGRLRGIDFTLPVPSAQIKSAILLAGLFARGNTVLRQPTASRDHTERLLKQMGASLEINGTRISLTPLANPLSPLNLHIPGDISSAAYFLIAGAVHPNARITIRDCGINPTRTGIVDVLVAMGAELKIENERREAGEPLADIVIESSELRGIEVGGDIIPRLIDEIPVLAVAGCVAKGKTVIRDAAELRVKESDRIATLSKELRRLGAEVEELPDGMIIHGGKILSGTEVDSHFDHRLAMTLAIAGLVAKGDTTINHAQVTQISYPAFWQDLMSLRA
ncbi:MAG TPA: 3-phosphoshikimate 1-carboxyvinyltransferase [Dehalococcoidia bacterium]|nr:3-phosphoshikimate 1-carboxyvinyltransferase [Dehalococcoidia bacterium]